MISRKYNGVSDIKDSIKLHHWKKRWNRQTDKTDFGVDLFKSGVPLLEKIDEQI